MENGRFEYTATIPANTSATVNLPCDRQITLNGELVSELVHRVGAGTHRFVVAG